MRIKSNLRLIVFCFLFFILSSPAFALNRPPIAGTITPSAGSSNPDSTILFTTTYADPDGWKNIQSAYFLINTSTTGKNCFFAYYDTRTNKVYLRDDSNTRWLGGFMPGTAKIIQNSYVKLNCSATSVSAKGTDLIIKWSITFKPVFSGEKNLYLYVRDIAGASSGWVKKGTWTITNKPPTIGTVIPLSGVSDVKAPVSFTTTFNDPDGWQNIQYVYFIIGASSDGINSFCGYYNRNTNSIYLRDDANTKWLGGFLPGSGNTIENSYVKLNCASTTVSGADKTLTIKWNITFKPLFAGKKYTYLFVKDNANAVSGWIKIGSWTVDIAPPIGNIKINNYAKYTNSPSVYLTLAAADAESKVVGVLLSNDNINWSSQITYIRRLAWTLTNGDGVKTVYAKFMDEAGHWSKVVSDDIILDTIPPQNPSITIKEGKYTNKPNTNLVLSAQDAAQMAISEDPLFINTQWLPYAVNQTYTLSNGDGKKTIYVKYRDLARNETQAVSNFIILDTIPPQIQSTTPANNYNTNQSKIDIKGIFIEANIDTITINGIPAVIKDNTFTAQGIPLPIEGDNAITIELTDLANNQYAHIMNIIKDTIPPQVQSTSPADNYNTNKSKINISGTFLEANIDTIKVNGIPAVIQRNNFTITDVLIPVEGNNNIMIELTDLAGNKTTHTINVVKDSIPPQDPVINAVTSPTNKINQIIAGTKSADTKEIKISCKTAAIGNITYPSNTTWQAEINNMNEGINLISAIASDEAGNQSKAVYTSIVIDITPPVITITSPKNGDIIRRGFTNITGTIDDYDAVITANGITGTIEGGIFTVQKVLLQKGANNIKIQAVDNAGNNAAQTITITYDDTPMVSVWPISRQNERGTSQSPYTISAKNQFRWKFSSRKGTNGNTTLAGNYLYALIGNALYKLDYSGDVKYVYPFSVPQTLFNGSTAASSVAVDIYNHCLYAYDTKNTLSCFNEEDGSLIWKFNLVAPQGYQVSYSYQSKLLLSSDNKIYFAAATSFIDQNSKSLQYDQLYCVSNDGTLAWLYNFNTYSSYDISTPVVDANDNVYALQDNGILTAINPNGTLKWDYDTGYKSNYGHPAVGINGTIYVGTDALYAINPQGALLWKYSTSSYIKYPIAVSLVDNKETIYSIDGYNIYSINTDGTLNWSYKSNDYDHFNLATIDRAGIILLTSYNYFQGDKLTCLKPDSTLFWKIPFDYTSINSEITIGADGTIFALNRNGILYALGTDDIPPKIDGPSTPYQYFSPNSDGEKDIVEIKMILSEKADWTIAIKDSFGAIVKQFSGNGEEFISQIWDGKDENGIILPDGEYKIQITAEDTNKNKSVSNETIINIDTIPPQNPSISIDDNKPGSKFIELILSATGANEMRVSEDQKFLNTQWQETQSPLEFTLSPLDGAKTVYAQFRDMAGNKTQTVSLPLILNQPLEKDTISVTIAEGKYTSSQNISLILNAKGADKVLISEDPQFKGAVWQNFNPTMNFTLSANEGKKIIYVKFKDTYTNEESDAYTASITYQKLDNMNPRVSIKQGAVTFHKTITLMLSAQGAVSMLISEDKDFRNAVWESYKTTEEYPLSIGRGKKTIYVKYKDAQGNQTQPVSADIILDIPFLLVNFWDMSEYISRHSTSFPKDLIAKGYNYEIWPVEQLGFPSAEVMNRYDLVFLTTGLNNCPEIDFNELSVFLDNKGSLYLSSQCLLEMQDTDSFAKKYLGINGHQWISMYNMGNINLSGIPGDPITGNKSFTIDNADNILRTSINVLSIENSVKAILQDNKGQSYAIRYPENNLPDTYNLVYFAFFGERIGILPDAVDWLLKKIGVSGIIVKDNKGDISLNSDTYIQFTSNLDQATINSDNIQITSSKKGILNGKLTYDTNTRTVKFDPAVDFIQDENITIKVTTGLKNVFGKVFEKDYLYTYNLSNFIEPLNVTETTPSINASNVSLFTSLLVYFNHPLNPAAVTQGTVTVNGSLSGALQGNVTLDAENKIIAFTPGRNFLPNETITVSLSNTIKDIYGVGFTGGNNYTWPFETGNVEDKTPPDINITNLDPIYFTNSKYYISINDALITCILSEKCFWKVSINDAKNQILKTYTGIGNEISVKWNGLNANGEEYAGGTYNYKITAKDVAGNETISLPKTIIIDKSFPSSTNNKISVTEKTVNEPKVDLTLTCEQDVVSIKVLYRIIMGWSEIIANVYDNNGWEAPFQQKVFTLPNPSEGYGNITCILKNRVGCFIVIQSNYFSLDYLPEVLGLIIDDTFSPNNDGISDTLLITGKANVPLNWDVAIKNDKNQLVHSYKNSELASSLNIMWDGRDIGGNLQSNGTYTCTINGTDKENNPITEITKQITLETNPPQNASIAIQEAPITNQTSVTLKLNAVNADDMRFSESVNLNGAGWVKYQNTASFYLSAGDGLKTVYAQFRNEAGNISQAVSASITLDTAPPAPVTINPVTTPTDKPEQTISGAKSLDSVKINIYGPVQVKNLSYPTADTWTADLTLQEGFNDISVTAEDNLGNISQSTQTTIYYSWNIEKPAIEITSPKNGDFVKTGAVTGRVSDPTAVVAVNGQLALVGADGIFSVNLVLQEGKTEIAATALDKNGDMSTDTIKIIYDITNPIIKVINPQNGAIALVTPITVAGTVNDANINEVSVNLVPAVINGGDFTAEGVSLEQGQNTITAEATDKAGNTSQDSITITLDPDASNYRLEEISGSTIMLDPASLPEAGAQQELKVKLYVNDEPANGEIIQFRITEGKGQLNNAQVQTDSEGEASVMLTLDTNAEHINKITAYPAQCPQGKVEFIVSAKSLQAGKIIKLTDEALTYVPDAEIELIIKVTDQYNNPIEDEVVNFSVIAGDGLLQEESATTNELGEVYVGYTVGPVAGVVNKIKTELANDANVNTTFNIQTIAIPNGIKVEDIIDKVNQNDAKIQDIQADMIIKSDMPWSDPEIRLHIWQKGDKQKTQMTYPKAITTARPQVILSPNPDITQTQQVIYYLPKDNLYGVGYSYLKNGNKNQTKILSIDYNKGIVLKSENLNIERYGRSKVITEYQNWAQIPQANNVWAYNKKVETFSTNFSNDMYITTDEISNRQVNTGIQDKEFE